MLTENEVNGIYRGLLGRDPEGNELIDIVSKKQETIEGLIQNIKISKKFKQIFLKNSIPERVIVFMHIPKTAGTYLRGAWLINNIQNYWWHGEKVSFPQLNDFYENDIISSVYGLIGGHLNISSCLKMKTIQPRIFLTVIRDPISRIISFYNYIKRNEKHQINALVKTHTLYELLESKSKFYKIVFNQQVRSIIADRKLIEKFSRDDLLVIGRQDKIDQFVEVVNNLTGFDKNMSGGKANAGIDGYEKSVEAEPDFDKAMKILENITRKEKELYTSIDDVMVMDQVEYKEFVQKFT